MGVPLPVEALAWLVKDNLHAKHLVLTVEDLFVEFLECPLSEEETLALEPMESYQRMLIHRLADLFGLAHESIGKGDDRHLVVEKCEDSLIPAVLVSDVLDSGDGEMQHPLLSRQLLKRSAHPADGSEIPSTSKNPMLSLEERQAAYRAARQRIFSGTWKSSEEIHKERGSARPRSDPVVARRMIAHALGTPKRLTLMCPCGPVPAQDLNIHSLVGRDADKNWAETPVSTKTRHAVDLKETMQQSSVKAAKRMFANALGLPPGGGSSRVTPQQQVPASYLSSLEGTQILASMNASRGFNPMSVSDSSDEVDYQDHVCRSRKRANVPTVRLSRHVRPGGAACRIFAQALGLPNFISSDVKRLPSPTSTVPLPVYD